MNDPKSDSKSNPKTDRAREKILALWRGVDLREEEGSRRDSSRLINKIMPKVLQGLRIDRRQSETEIIKVWNHILDPNIVAHAQPTGIRNGTLFVTVDHSAWLDEIVRYRRREILERLQNSFGKELITKISFRVG